MLQLARLKEAKETLENPTRPKFSTKLTPGQFDRVTYVFYVSNAV